MTARRRSRPAARRAPPRHGMLARAALLALAAAGHAPQLVTAQTAAQVPLGAQARAGPTVVADAEALRRALQADTKDIVLVEHISLPRREGDEAFAVLGAGDHSIRGNCSRPNGVSKRVDVCNGSCKGDARRHGNQCVVIAPQTFLSLESTAKQLWLDNIFVSIDKGDERSKSAAVLTSRFGARASVYITGSTFEGGCKGSIGVQADDARLLVANSHFDHFLTPGPGAAISAVGADSAVTLRAVRFTHNDADGQQGAAVHIARRASVINCTFENAGQGMEDVACLSPGDTVFSDQDLQVSDECVVKATDSADAASDARRRELPRLSDAWIASMREARPSFASSVATAPACEADGTPALEADGTDGGGSNVPAAVGGAVAALVLLLVAVAAAALLARRRRRRRRAAAAAVEASDASGWPARGKRRRSSDHKAPNGSLEAYNTDGTGSPCPDRLRPEVVRTPTELAVIDGRPGSPAGFGAAGAIPEEPRADPPTAGRTADPQTELTTSVPSIAAFRICSSSTVATPLEALEDALDALYATREPFMGVYELFSSIERRSGGQGLVQFARSRDAAGEFAIKFYVARAAFDRERALYCVEALRSMMPATHEMLANDGEGGAAVARAPNGFVWPPCIVIERGESLDEWARRETPDFITIMQVLCHVATRLRMLHAQGWVHRDIKPGNILRLKTQHSWTLIDFGCVAKTGTVANLSYSLAYAPPEVVHAIERGQKHAAVSEAVDMWALGVIAFELLTRRRTFPYGTQREEIFDRIAGRAALPWECPAGAPYRAAALRGLRRSVMLCLSRDPNMRPSAERLLVAWNHMFDSISSVAGDTSDYTPSHPLGSDGITYSTYEATAVAGGAAALTAESSAQVAWWRSATADSPAPDAVGAEGASVATGAHTSPEAPPPTAPAAAGVAGVEIGDLLPEGAGARRPE